MGAHVGDEDKVTRATYDLAEQVARVADVLEVALPEVTKQLKRIGDALWTGVNGGKNGTKALHPSTKEEPHV